MRKVAFHTLGCKLNQYETESMREQLEESGYKTVSFDDQADVYVINTCTVTEKTEQECRRLVRRLKRNNDAAKIYLTGCYAQLQAEEIAQIPGVSGVIGNPERSELIKHITSFDREDASKIAISDISQQRVFEPFKISGFANYTRAFLKIQDGCNLICAFCAVRIARGPSRSRPVAEIVAEAKRLVENGYLELIITGVHIESYGNLLQTTLMPVC